MTTSDPRSRSYLLDDLRRLYVRLAANEGWYRQSWLGVPIWQLPGDLIILQRLVCTIKPRVIVETGTKYGGSAIFFASLLQNLGLMESRVITIDIQETKEARENLLNHRLSHFINRQLIGNALDPSIIREVRQQLNTLPGPILLFLDDWHGGDHVLEELNVYTSFVCEDSIAVIADTTFEDLAGTPVAPFDEIRHSNPRSAIREFLAEHSEFEQISDFITGGLSNFYDGVIRRRRDSKHSIAYTKPKSLQR